MEELSINEPIKLLPLNNNKFDKPFPNPFTACDYGDGSKPYTLIELNMMAVMGSIKDKPLWYEKINNPEIANKWREEIKSQVIDGEVMHESQIDYIFDELRYYSTTCSKELSISPVDGVWQSDNIINEELRQKLASQVAVLERDCNDWHPGSNNQMLDLVHPSLYPYVAGVTRELTVEPDLLQQSVIESFKNTIGGGILSKRTLTDLNAKYKDKNMSANYQWLPSEVVVDENGSCKILSYINNLHPIEHVELYQTLEQILEKFIPLYNNVLTDLDQPKERRHEVDMYNLYTEIERGDMSDDGYYAACDEDYETRIPNVSPIVQPFTPPPPPVVESVVAGENTVPTSVFTSSASSATAPAASTSTSNVKPAKQPIDLRSSRLQVIVKLATIILTPENPVYNGGAWHVEGMKNEHIVASGIYYWHTENITESKLSFRTNVREPDYEQSDDKGVMAVYGLENDCPLVQNLGSVTCIQGRSVCWPNTSQHQVQNFTLQDPTKNGVRKILVFFLVDPTQRIISTSIVPPQQPDWIQKELENLKLFTELTPRSLPRPIQELIMEYSDVAHFSHALALEVRLKLMEERRFFTVQNTEERFEREFSLCEH